MKRYVITIPDSSIRPVKDFIGFPGKGRPRIPKGFKIVLLRGASSSLAYTAIPFLVENIAH